MSNGGDRVMVNRVVGIRQMQMGGICISSKMKLIEIGLC